MLLSHSRPSRTHAWEEGREQYPVVEKRAHKHIFAYYQFWDFRLSCIHVCLCVAVTFTLESTSNSIDPNNWLDTNNLVTYTPTGNQHLLPRYTCMHAVSVCMHVHYVFISTSRIYGFHILDVRHKLTHECMFRRKSHFIIYLTHPNVKCSYLRKVIQFEANQLPQFYSVIIAAMVMPSESS